MDAVTCTVHGWRFSGLKPGRPGSTDGVSAAAALAIPSNGAMMHFDAEKRTDMFVQGAQQSEETQLFHIIAYVFLPFALCLYLFAYPSPWLVSLNQPPMTMSSTLPALVRGGMCIQYSCGHSTVGSKLLIMEASKVIIRARLGISGTTNSRHGSFFYAVARLVGL